MGGIILPTVINKDAKNDILDSYLNISNALQIDNPNKNILKMNTRIDLKTGKLINTPYRVFVTIPSGISLMFVASVVPANSCLYKLTLILPN